MNGLWRGLVIRLAGRREAARARKSKVRGAKEEWKGVSESKVSGRGKE